MNEIVEILQAGLEKLGPNGENWIKGRFTDGVRGMCVSEAINHSYILAWILRQAASAPSSLVDWNDAPERTFLEVKQAFLKAIEIAKNKEEK